MYMIANFRIYNPNSMVLALSKDPPKVWSRLGYSHVGDFMMVTVL